MKEIEQNLKTKTEVSIKQKKQIEHELVDQLIPHNGHLVWQIDKLTLEIEPAKYSNATYVLGGENNKREIITKDGFVYVAAMNKRNALKKFKAGKKGGKEVEKVVMDINNGFM